MRYLVCIVCIWSQREAHGIHEYLEKKYCLRRRVSNVDKTICYYQAM